MHLIDLETPIVPRDPGIPDPLSLDPGNDGPIRPKYPVDPPPMFQPGELPVL